jgi:hypothetical protein
LLIVEENTKEKAPYFRAGPVLYLMPGSSLLSHGETPHYHRRYGVSLLSSAWGQVGPPRYCRQANSVIHTASFHDFSRHFAIRTNLGTSLKISS